MLLDCIGFSSISTDFQLAFTWIGFCSGRYRVFTEFSGFPLAFTEIEKTVLRVTWKMIPFYRVLVESIGYGLGFCLWIKCVALIGFCSGRYRVFTEFSGDLGGGE